MQPQTLLIIDDDHGICEQLTWCFDHLNVITAHNQLEAIAAFKKYRPLVVTLDLGLPPFVNTTEEGLSTLQAILSLAPKTKVIMLTGQDDRRIAMQAIHLGAYDFYQKPVDPQGLKLIVSRAFYLAELELEQERYLEKSWQHTGSENGLGQFGLLSASHIMQKTNRLAEKVAPTNATVLLLGESGTGKERFANAIHGLSDRKHKPFVAINCAAIPENLLESELFGHEKGAFTGAAKQVIGKIETAQGGTLFLDEIGDLPLSLQPKLLRFLQERVIERLGGRQQIHVDVRVICATFQPLDELRAIHQFRDDLFYRISEIIIPIPPLCQRGKDVLLLAHAFLRRYAQEFKRPIKGYSPNALTVIEQYTWPGNVRELENKIKRAVILCEGQKIEVEDLDIVSAMPLMNTTFSVSSELSSIEAQHTDEYGMDSDLNLKRIRENVERDTIEKAIERAGENISKAAELLGVTRPTLYNLMDKLGVRDKLGIKDKEPVEEYLMAESNKEGVLE